MADMLFHGKHGVDANPDQAMNHFHDLADAGDPGAMVNMAVMHIKVCVSQKFFLMVEV